jgi:hypothetical protein
MILEWGRASKLAFSFLSFKFRLVWFCLRESFVFERVFRV